MLKAWAIGRLVAEPTRKTVKKNDLDYNVCEFRLACQQRKDATDFINGTAWRGMGDFIFKHVHKGQKIYVEGYLHIPPYDKAKGRAYDPYIVVYGFEFCDSRPRGSKTKGDSSNSVQDAKDFDNTLDDDDLVEGMNSNDS